MRDLGSFIWGSETSCGKGFEKGFFGAACYPKCKAGYVGVWNYCWSVCNLEQFGDQSVDGVRLRNTGDDWKDSGAVCSKRLYDRGVGYMPDACSDSNRQMFVGMCYTKCQGGFSATTWSPCTCSQSCPPNTYEGGFANCTKTNSYGRGGGNWGDGCPGGYTNMGLWCTNWKNFKSSGFSCPGGDYDPKNNPGGRCRFAPRSGRSAYGINTCYGKSIALGAALAFDGTVNPLYPNGNIQLSDSNGNSYSAYGCYPDPSNPGSWITPRGARDDPQFFKSAYYPKWHPLSGCVSHPGSSALTYPTSATCKSLPNDPTSGISSIQAAFPGGLYSDVPIDVPVDADGASLGGEYNTVRAPQQSNSCEENWGTLCYPKCDIGFYGFGCCVCSPNCSPLRDDGATCHRKWYDRGVGKIPDACRDDNRNYDELLCYTKCKQNFKSFCTTCTRQGCPYGGKGETPLCCSKDSFSRSTGIAIPAAAGKLNSKINIGPLANGLTRIILNVLVILLCLLAALFIFSTNMFLRTKHIKLKYK